MTSFDSSTGYSVKNHEAYLELHYAHIDDMGSFTQAAKDLMNLAQTTGVKKLLLYMEAPYDTVGDNIRIEGLNLADGFRRFDKVAIAAPDPAQFNYLEHVNETLKSMGIITDPANFRLFDTLGDATAWIKTA